MLDEYKQMYEQQANLIPNWRQMSKNDLLNLYVQNQKNQLLANNYLSAIICRYWNSIDKLYMKSYPYANQYDCYDWLIRSILYVLKNKRWLDQSSSVYNDKNGPDKILNRCIKCTRLTYFQQLNRYKRKVSIGTLSLDQILNETGDYILNDDLVNKSQAEIQDEMYEQNLVNDVFSKKQYFLAVLIDAILNNNCFNDGSEMDDYRTDLDRRKVVKVLSHIDDQYCKRFSYRYFIDLQKVKKAMSYISNLKSQDMYNMIQTNLKLLYHKYLKQE